MMAEKLQNDEQINAHVINLEDRNGGRPFDVCGNKLVWVDEKEIKYCNIVEDDLSQLMVDRISKKFQIKNYGLEIFSDHEINPIKCVWGWFRKIMTKLQKGNAEENHLNKLSGISNLLNWGEIIKKQLNEIKMPTPMYGTEKLKYFLGRNYLSHDN